MSELPEEDRAPPIPAQLASIFAGIGLDAGIFYILVFLIPTSPWIVIPVLIVMGFGSYYGAISCISRYYTGSWSNYPSRVKNIDMSD